ncbi:hypothetical protein BDZ89DRAFT_1068060 [Hymenopellis radicata]|nr:hypothetical protein BDZ89DRAFT_1068060 [Hymenopellis radicata]
MYHQQPRPRVSIQSGARQPINPSPSGYSPYSFELTPAPQPEEENYYLANPWDGVSLPNPYGERPRAQRSPSPSRASTVAETGYVPPISFPEPQIYRSASTRAPNSTLAPLYPHTITHRHSRSDMDADYLRMQRAPSNLSLASSYFPEDSDHSASGSVDSHGDVDSVARELSAQSLESEEGIRQFQAGKLSENEQEWHRLQEVQRQSVMFEVCKSERDYVFITPLTNASPPIISEQLLPGFISEVFGNLSQILVHHQRILAALFDRQREQHPFVITISDIILDATLKADYRSSYETYIKHYPIAESHHRKELRRNEKYRAFIQSVSSDPRIRKRDLITFLSRPVTRLPRLNLLLEQILKLTDKETEHPDLESLPVSLDILKSCIKSTQPGIEAAEAKVKFWALCEGLVYQKGEILDMDLYDDSRTLIYAGPVARRIRSSSTWNDLTLALLDNFILMTREETKANGVVKRYIMSRPIPLSFLRLASFDGLPEHRKVYDKEGSVLGLRYHNEPVYPFTIYHASSKASKRYTLFVTSDAVRKKWYNALVDAIGVHKARQDGNMFFDPRTLTDGFFRTIGSRINQTSTSKLTGKISSAVSFVSGGRPYVAVGCTAGIFVSPRGREEFTKVLNHISPLALAAVQTHQDKTFNKFIIHHESSLISYSLDLIVHVSQGQAEIKLLNASMEKIAGQNSSVMFFKHTHVGSRVLIIYASKKHFQVSLNLQVLEVLDISEAVMSPKRGLKALQTPSFRPFGDPGYVPKDAYDVTTLVKTIGICTSDGIVIVDPTNIAKSATNVVPDLSDSSANMPMAGLKSKVEGAKPLGLVRMEADQLLAVYDTIGFYINRHGIPGRNCGYISWETHATSFAYRGNHVLLFSDEFVEIRQISTGRLVQVIEGQAIRLLYSGPTANSDDPILFAMKGNKDDQAGVSDKLCELVETSEINTAHPSTPAFGLWDEWDM